MARHAVTLIPGDGVGPEICDATVRVLEATGVGFDWDVQQAGEGAIAKFGTPLPDQVLESVRKNKVALKGPITTPVGSGFRSVNVALRQALDLYALVRPVKAYKGARNLRDDRDFIIVRENTEDIYAGIEFEQGTPDAAHLIEEISGLAKKAIRKDSGLSIKPISISGSERVVQFAFDYARKYKRDVVRLLVFADPILHSSNHDFGNSLQRKVAAAADQLQQALLAKLSEFIFRFRHAVAVSHEDIARGKMHFLFFENNFRKQPDDQSTGFELANFPIVMNDERREMAAIGVHKFACGSIKDAEK